MRLVVVGPVERPSAVFSLDRVFLLIGGEVPDAERDMPRTVLNGTSTSLVTKTTGIVGLREVFLVTSDAPVESFIRPVLVTGIIKGITPSTFIFYEPGGTNGEGGTMDPVTVGR